MKNRDEAELLNTFWLVSRDQQEKLLSKVLRDKLKHDSRCSWHFQNYYKGYQSNVCSKKSNWDKYLSQFLMYKHLIYQ